MLYQHPLAYLLGLQGTALLRAFHGQHDREFTLARFAEIRALLDNAERFGDGVTTRPLTAEEGYDVWAASYDQPNDLIELEEPIIRPILDRLPVGRALDAACGTEVLPEHPSDIWTLAAWYPAASRAATAGNPLLIFWRFQRTLDQRA